ncbi:MAG TPA: S-layer homology domain-containing protein, partial [Candidatus Aveggerthella excrementigallinarum]|nr:S-layer homology domain-containing protein [Candidatus Aveggerthella excrementigallinarum]
MNVTTQGIGHKVMSVLMALVLAIGLAPLVPAGNAWAADPQDDNDPANALAVWQGHKFNYNVEQNKDKEYVVTSGEQFAVESVIDPATQTALDSDEYTVVYFNDYDKNDELTGGELIVSSDKTISGKVGSMPKTPGDYMLVVLKTDSIPSNYAPKDGQSWNDWAVKYMPAGQTLLYKAQAFTVNPALVSVDEAYAFEYDATNPSNLLDTDFMYKGYETAQQVGIALDGVHLRNDIDYTYTWTAWPGKEKGYAEPTYDDGTNTFAFTEAGTYSVEISGYTNGGYTGDKVVTFEVAPIDLTNDVITAKKYYTYGEEAGVLTDMTSFLVNGEEITEPLASTIKVDPYLFENGDKHERDFTTMEYVGSYTYELSDIHENGNVIGGPRQVTAYTTEQAAVFTYDDEPLASIDEHVFNLAEDDAFDTELLNATATIDGKETNVPFTKTVTKDGEEVTSFNEPGKYVLTVESLDAEGYVYGGIETVTFYVVRDVLENPVAYMTLDGKYVTDDNNEFTYTQSAMTPVVTVKDGDKVLTAGEDFTVAYTKDGEPVDEILNVGKYQAVISLNGYIVNTPGADELTIDFEVTKAVIDHVEAVTESYGAIALPSDGSAATVSFVGYTTDKASGIAYTLAPEDLWVVYFKGGQEVEADELTAAGNYTADVTILDTCANLEGGQKGVAFILTDAVSYVDVSVDAWYVDEVYKATQNHYVKGMGNKLFFPEAQMTRAQFAQVLYNMAGEPAWAPDTYPTQFSDVTADAWYAKAVSWAVEAGVV